MHKAGARPHDISQGSRVSCFGTPITIGVYVLFSPPVADPRCPVSFVDKVGGGLSARWPNTHSLAQKGRLECHWSSHHPSPKLSGAPLFPGEYISSSARGTTVTMQTDAAVSEFFFPWLCRNAAHVARGFICDRVTNEYAIKTRSMLYNGVRKVM